MNKTISRHKKIIALISVMLVIILTAFDQFTKWLAVTKLKGNDAFVILPKVFELRYLENRGVAFGMYLQRIINGCNYIFASTSSGRLEV